MEKTVITTIIPTCNRPETLKRAIESVLHQIHPGIKICIYDNSSDDRTEKMVNALWGSDPRIHYWKHPVPISAQENFSFGMSQVTTPFFSFLADDDVLLPDFYQLALSLFERFPDAHFFLGSTLNISDKGVIRGVPANAWDNKEYYLPHEGIIPIIRNYINWTGAVFRITVRDQVGEIDQTIKIIDFDFVLRAASMCSFVFSKIPCALFIEHSASYSGNASLKLIWPGLELIEEKILKTLSDNEPLAVLFHQEMQQHLRCLLRHFLVRSFLKSERAECEKIIQIYNEKFGKKKWHSFLLQALKSRSTHRLFSSLIKLRRGLIGFKTTFQYFRLYHVVKSVQ